MQAIEKLTQMRNQLQEEHGINQGDLLGAVRKEREQDRECVWEDET